MGNVDGCDAVGKHNSEDDENQNTTYINYNLNSRQKICPVDCIKIETVKVEKGTDIPDIKHTGITSKGTRKALLVQRFDIDMTECCYCNLCVYPCPEECIYMTGGPNSHKHPIDYEFSQYDRGDMIYRFAKDVSDEKMDQIVGEKNKTD